MTWSLICALPLCGIPAGAFAQSVPPGLRACASESDSLKRLVCYDREMARLTKSAPRPATAPPPPPQAAPPPPAAAAQAPSAPVATPATPPPPAAAGSEASQPPKQSLWKSFVGGDASRMTAHVAGLDRSADSMVLHLDNGQVWQQIEPASGSLTLRVGDSVTIEKHLGSYWLSSRYVSNMKVRLQSQ
jgi:hypothetical protein